MRRSFDTRPAFQRDSSPTVVQAGSNPALCTPGWAETHCTAAMAGAPVTISTWAAFTSSAAWLLYRPSVNSRAARRVMARAALEPVKPER